MDYCKCKTCTIFLLTVRANALAFDISARQDQAFEW
jgi:hypothetical protein